MHKDYYILVIWDDITPELFGPYPTKSKRDKIISLSSKSKLYIQFQYTPFLRKRMKHYFKHVKIKFVPLNFPPAFLYVCKQKANP